MDKIKLARSIFIEYILEELPTLYDDLYTDTKILNKILNLSCFGSPKECKKYLIKLTPYLDYNIKYAERFYHVFNDLYEIPKCVCGNIVKWSNYFKNGYNKYCSNKCANKSNVNKIQNSIFERTGYKHALQNPEVKEKFKQTCLDKYGVENPSLDSNIVQKRKDTYFEKTGYYISTQNPEVKEKFKQTCLDKYGVENPSLDSNIVQKRKDTYFEKTGYNIPFQNPKVKEKTKKTLLQKTGYDHIMKNPEISKNIALKIKDTKLKNFYKSMKNGSRLTHYIPLFLEDEYDGLNKYYKWKCTKCNTEFLYKIYNGIYIPRCPKCYPQTSSMAEIEIYDFCKTYFRDISKNVRILDNFEIDIFIDEIKIGIEHHGLIYHTENFGKKSQSYHKNKTEKAANQNIQLIQIFADEWLYKKEIVKSILLSKFNKLPNKIFARKLSIFKIDNEFAKQFYNENHIQGYINGHHYGLVKDNIVYAMMTIGKPRFSKNHDIEIYRFSTAKYWSVPGGLSKLMKHIIKKHNSNSIITYADLRYGYGIGYKKAGFNFIKTTNPGYFYYRNDGTLVRYNRVHFQKHKLKDKLEIFDKNLSEWENMKLNGYDRIWDCGNAIYEKT